MCVKEIDFVAAPKRWNELPEYIRKSETLPIFKTRLKSLKTYIFLNSIMTNFKLLF
jgi:hypothetical protein